MGIMGSRLQTGDTEREESNHETPLVELAYALKLVALFVGDRNLALDLAVNTHLFFVPGNTNSGLFSSGSE
jgi:hypothetical protein